MAHNEAAATNGEAGVVIQGGPRVGEAAIEAILCDGVLVPPPRRDLRPRLPY